jgi:hypothetical protein
MYVICRVDRLPYMLIDFSDAIQARSQTPTVLNGNRITDRELLVSCVCARR